MYINEKKHHFETKSIFDMYNKSFVCFTKSTIAIVFEISYLNKPPGERKQLQYL